MKKVHPLAEEINFLKTLLPGSIQDHCKHAIIKNLPEGFLDALGHQPEWNNPQDLDVQEFDMEAFMEPDRESDLNQISMPDNNLPDADYDLEKVMAQFGKDAFGLYLPFHFFGKCWGIYLFKELIEMRVSRLLILFAHKKISPANFKRLYYYAIYRHELFHYQVERYCTKLELSLKKEIYYPRIEVFQKVRLTADWLEEALAEDAVLQSRMVPNRTKIKHKTIQEIYKRDLEDMPPGYRDYHCKTHGGPKEAHRKFASQLLETSLKPAHILPPLLSIKTEYNSIDREVPTYLVSGFSKIIRQKM